MTNSLNKFNLDFCRMHSPAKLRAIYKSENPEIVEALIEAVHGKQEIEVKAEKKTRKKKEIE